VNFSVRVGSEEGQITSNEYRSNRFQFNGNHILLLGVSRMNHVLVFPDYETDRSWKSGFDGTVEALCEATAD